MQGQVEQYSTSNLLAQLACVVDSHPAPDFTPTQRFTIMLQTISNNERVFTAALARNRDLTSKINDMSRDLQEIKERLEVQTPVSFELTSSMPTSVRRDKLMNFHFQLIDQQGNRQLLGREEECLLTLEEYEVRDRRGRSLDILFRKTWRSTIDVKGEVDFRGIFVPVHSRLSLKSRINITVSCPTDSHVFPLTIDHISVKQKHGLRLQSWSHRY